MALVTHITLVIVPPELTEYKLINLYLIVQWLILKTINLKLTIHSELLTFGTSKGVRITISSTELLFDHLWQRIAPGAKAPYVSYKRFGSF